MLSDPKMLPGMLAKEKFIEVVRNAPLVAIDLVVITHTPKQMTLLGLRNNEPARGTWYFPGGRIFKDESIKSAGIRIWQSELGMVPQDCGLIGVNDYFYGTNFAGEPGFGTHYVTLAFESILKKEQISLEFREPQHDFKRWFLNEEIFSDPMVHPNVKQFIKGHYQPYP